MASKFLYILLGFFASLALLEIVLRFCPVATGYGYQPLNAERPVLQGAALARYTYSLGWNFRRVSHGTLNNDGFISNRDYELSDGTGLLVIGDSYIQAAAVPEDSNLHAQLAAKLSPTEVIGLSRAGGALPDYLAMAKWGISRYHAGELVILAVSGDVADSVVPKTGGYYFQQTTNGLVQVRVDRPPLTLLQDVLNRSMLFRYLYDNLAFTVNFPKRPLAPEIAASGNVERLQKYRQICRYFLDQLVQMVPRDKITILIHRSRKNGTFQYESDVDVLRDSAQQRGFRVLDLGPIFASYENQNHQRLDSAPTDTHWNVLAQQLVADSLAPRLRGMLNHGDSN